MFKKAISVLLSLVMVLSLTPMVSFAAPSGPGGGTIYELTVNGITVTDSNASDITGNRSIYQEPSAVFEPSTNTLYIKPSGNKVTSVSCGSYSTLNVVFTGWCNWENAIRIDTRGDLNITGKDLNGGMLFSDATISSEGDVTITHMDAWNALNNLTVEQAHSLTINANGNAVNGNLVIGEKVGDISITIQNSNGNLINGTFTWPEGQTMNGYSSPSDKEGTPLTNGGKVPSGLTSIGGAPAATAPVEDCSTLGHSFTDYVSNNDATCTQDGTKTAVCDRDGCNEKSTIEDTGSKLGHSFTNYVSDENATCLEDGTKTAKCERCNATNTIDDVNSKLGHSFTNYVSDGNATCLEDGSKTAKCERCDVTDTVDDVDSKLGHSYGNYRTVDEYRHVRVCKNDSSHKVYGKHSFVDGECTKCGYVEEAYPDVEAGNDDKGFVDVPDDSYYKDAVDWAVENGITTGTSDTTFEPDGVCTRAQAVTFFYRAAGSPDVELSDKFEDIESGSYYEKAVSWAVENGITVGTSDTTFSPDANCSRAHIVTFLSRAAKAEIVNADNPFSDVLPDAYYYNSVLWAVANNITTGTTETTFSPDDDCTRAQIVTFIYRYMN